MIQIFSNSLGVEELAAVEKVFHSKWLGAGAECKEFEKELGKHFGTEQVLLLNNCTAGIYMALRALGIKAGDEVIISTANFVAIPNAVIDLGAKPVFADVDLDYFNLIPEEIERLKTKKTKAVFLLHYGGHPARFDEIRAACGRFPILEDSANAVSSKYKGKHCGTLGEAGMFSFDAMKTLVMGDGGALVVRDPKLFREAQALRYLGFAPKTTSGIDSLRQGHNRWWEFDVATTSGRFISNDILAAIGRVQLAKLPGFIEKRKLIWTYYQRQLRNVPGLILPPEPLPGTTGSYYLYWLRIPKKRDSLAGHLQEKGIYTTFRYFPLHLVPHYRSRQKLPKAEQMNEEALNIPLHQNLSDSDVQRIVESIRQFFKGT